MQSNVTEITQKLLGALDSNYNVTNMAAIVEVITLLERVTITKEMLETTRLGKHINELRKHLASDALAKRAKLLVKKWRNIVLVANQPPAAAVVVAASAAAPETIHTRSPALVLPARSPALVLPARSPALTNGQARPPSSLLPGQQDDGGGVGVGRKRPPSRLDAPHVTHAKKHRANGGAPQPPFDYDFSDNSNSSFKDAGGGHHGGGGGGAGATKVVVVNSDSNSSTSAQEAHVRESSHYDDQQQPKKRGRKKGSKNHKNLIEEAESSFSNKMAVSRGNAKVKTTQELIESLQNRALPPTAASAAPPPAATPVSPARSVDDWRERAAKLTERVSLIDQKLNSGGNRLKKHHHQQQQQHNQQPPQRGSNNSVHTPPLLRGTYSSRPVTPADDDDDEEDEEIIVVDDVPPSSKQRLLQQQQQQRLKSPSRIKAEPLAEEAAAHLVAGGVGVVGPASLSEEEALRRLPPLDASAYHLDDDDRDGGVCWCVLEEAPVDGAVVEEAAPPQGDVACVPPPPPPALVFREHADCPARARLEEKYRLKDVRDERVALLHASHVDGMNGNYGVNDTSATDTIATATPTSLTYANHYHHQQQQQSNQTQHSQQQSTPSSAAPDDINIVPNFYQLPAKGEACSETFKKYSISEAGDGGGGGDGHGDADAKSRVFREFHECLDRSSYDGNTLRILPYVIID